MARLFERLFGRSNPETKSGKLAKDRLQMVLVQDRIDMSSDKMKMMQEEIIEVMSKYVTVDMDNVDFALRNRERDGLFVAEIPFHPPADETKDSDNTGVTNENESAVKISVEEPQTDTEGTPQPTSDSDTDSKAPQAEPRAKNDQPTIETEPDTSTEEPSDADDDD